MTEEKEEKVTEYHVEFGDEEGHWKVTWKSKKMGYPAWDKRVALSAAKEMAKKHKPSKVVIHDRKGVVEKEIPYEQKTK
jgi:hypothetical protein